MFYGSVAGIVELNVCLRINLPALDKIGRPPPGTWSSLSMLAHVERQKPVAIIAAA